MCIPSMDDREGDYYLGHIQFSTGLKTIFKSISGTLRTCSSNSFIEILQSKNLIKQLCSKIRDAKIISSIHLISFQLQIGTQEMVVLLLLSLDLNHQHY